MTVPWEQWDFVAVTNASVLLSLTCPSAPSCCLPCVLFPLLVLLDVVVVATKNRSGTIVTVEKQNEEGY